MENQHNTPQDSEAALNNLRQEIDAIDEKMVLLLAQRMQVIAKVGELKKNNQEKFFVRSSREADMIKNLIAKADGVFPKPAIISIWRKIITAANMHEQPLSIAIHNPKNIPDYNYLLKEYYNNNVPLHNFDSATNVVAAIERGEMQIGVFALPHSDYEDQNKKEDSTENWWISLANNRLGLKVFAKIPFYQFEGDEKNSDQIQLVAVAAKNPEKSADDNTLLYLEVAKEISKNQIIVALKEQNLAAKILKSVKINQVEGMLFYLVETRGFWLENDEAVKNFSKSKIKPYVKVLGHYATPITI